MIALGLEILFRGIIEHVDDSDDAKRLTLLLAEFEHDLAKTVGLKLSLNAEQTAAANFAIWEINHKSNTASRGN